MHNAKIVFKKSINIGGVNMKKPFILIGCKKRERSEFKIREGVQPTYALLYLTKGSFFLNIDGKQTILQAGDCAIFYDDIDFTRSVIEPITFIILQFQPNPSCPFRIPVPVGKVDFLNPDRVRDSIRKYEALIDSDDPRSIYYKEHLLEDILLQAYAENHSTDRTGVNSSAETTHDVTVIRATGYIRENLDKKLTVETVCHAAETNPSTLNFKFRKELSTSVGGYITAERMKRARFMLSNTTHTIRDISASCGFDSVYYFSSAFRKYNGLSPTEYRKQYR